MLDTQSPQRIEKDTSWIFQAKEVVITEKIHGTSYRIQCFYDPDGKFLIKYGTHHQILGMPFPNSHQGFVSENIQADDHLRATLENFTKFMTGAKPGTGLTFFGEIYGSDPQIGNVQHLGPRYAKGIHLRIFDVALTNEEDNVLLDWQSIEQLCLGVGFRTVPLMYQGKPDVEVFKSLLTAHSYTAEEHGMAELKPIEGIVIKENPPRRIKPGLSFDQQWNVWKYKNEEFKEVKSARVRSEQELKDLGLAHEFADRVITEERLNHVLSQLKEQGVDLKNDMQDLKFVPKAMVEDVMKEESELFGEYLKKDIKEKDLTKTISQLVSQLYRKRVYPEL